MHYTTQWFTSEQVQHSTTHEQNSFLFYFVHWQANKEHIQHAAILQDCGLDVAPVGIRIGAVW